MVHKWVKHALCNIMWCTDVSLPVYDCYRHQKDVALVSLSNILHQVHYSNEAAIVIHAAIEISREANINYFTLGNIYAVSNMRKR